VSEGSSSHEALMQFLYCAPIGLVQTTLDGTVEIINPMSVNLLMPLCRSGNLDNLFETLETVAPQFRTLAADFDQPNGVVGQEVRVDLAPESRRDGAPEVLSISMVKLDGARLMTMISDVTLEVHRERSELTRRLRHAERTDRLTQMPNREGMRREIQLVLDRSPVQNSGQFAVFFMNCDRFKQINDRLGHAVGDEVLGLVADRLRCAVRQDTLVSRATGSAETAARIGSDEFVVFLDNLGSADDVPAIAQRLLDSLGKPYVIASQHLYCSVSIGIVLQDQAAADAEVVLQDASIAMMEAKRSGGACFTTFEPAMRERAARLGSMEADLRRAVADREFFLVYQPVVSLQKDGDSYGVVGCAGVEALVRWHHPTHGIVSPAEFIPAAEQCGLIGAIGEFALETACRQFVEWHKQLGSRAPQTLAVNLSRAQLSRHGFIDTVRNILQSSGVQPALLQLEVTESLAAQDKEVQKRLRELKGMGMTLALDDFGTGFSSLASLHLLPVDTVKIDRSFVIQADSSLHHQVLINATVMVAKSLGMSTVAEGIETQAQAEAVRQAGCDKGQGYLFSKPLSAADLLTRLTVDRPLSSWERCSSN
jgi:diguanylate cyclase (GGDEF)-like protein